MIISILGTAGAKFDKQRCQSRRKEDGEIDYQFAEYDLSLFGKETKAYKNATHFLLEAFGDERFVFIGTACSITFQKEILSQSLKGREIVFEEVGDNDLDDIFEKIYMYLQESSERVILDVTHGFRHQPIMAIFASTLSQFLERKELEIIFAKEVEQFKKYAYISLNDYIEITQISLLLSGFIRTFNFIPVKNLKLVNNALFEHFSKALLSNDLVGVKKYSKALFDHLHELKKNQDLRHLYKLLDQIDQQLYVLKSFDDKRDHEKYKILAKLVLDKNYLIVALTYLFESLREYCSWRFSSHLQKIRFKNDYEKNTAVMDIISNFKRNGKPNQVQKRYPQIVENNRAQFRRIDTIYKEIRTLRNDLAHINKTKNFEDIKQQLNALLFKIEKIYDDQLLKRIVI